MYTALNVEELHKILTELIKQGKGDYTVLAECGTADLDPHFGVDDDIKIVCF